ncbi:DUF6864 domain-containing function [Vibrio metschnikovii]|uniref:DUF6864 domain-containing function n=1 Tax=Vibrio metschnikovii TaxID=28172 RepID=UPI001C3035E7|nr:hypothetical protein [Vibrio metschnikovii]
MIKIGNLQVVVSELLLVPEHETVEIEYDDEQGNDFKLFLRFEEDPDLKKENGTLKSSFRVEPHGECALMVLTNWKSMGTSFKEPVQFAELDSGRSLHILVHVAHSGSLYRANIQLMLGGEE